MKPLYIWAGGKTKMFKHYNPLMPKKVNTYSEPFFGGGAMLLNVINRYNPNTIYINDINVDLMNIYLNVKDNYSEFIEIIDYYSYKFLMLCKEDRKEFYYSLREDHAWGYKQWTPIKQSATLYFLMKTGFNGIWQINKNTNNRYGTPSGLLSQTDKVYDKEIICHWHTILNNRNTIITSDDWSNVPISDFTFYDPPYRDSFADYNNPFSDKECLKLIDIVENNTDVWLCNRDSGDGFFENRKADLFKFPITYTAGRRKKTKNGHEAKKATEILLLNSSSNFTKLFDVK